MKAGSKLVRWILVVTLGCSLGLLYIYAVVSVRTVRPNVTRNIYIANRLSQPDRGFKLSEDSLGKDLTEVIEQQLAAFRQNDFPKAYQFAAASLKSNLPLPSFERMVRHTYPLIAQSRSAQFGVIVDNGRQALVNVSITGESGQLRHYQYLLQFENGAWRIFGVTEVKSLGITI
jgi:Domain of unknown function (DUF4864)